MMESDLVRLALKVLLLLAQVVVVQYLRRVRTPAVVGI